MDIENMSSKPYAQTSTQNLASHETLYVLHKSFKIWIISGFIIAN